MQAYNIHGSRNNPIPADPYNPREATSIGALKSGLNKDKLCVTDFSSTAIQSHLMACTMQAMNEGKSGATGQKLYLDNAFSAVGADGISGFSYVKW